MAQQTKAAKRYITTKVPLEIHRSLKIYCAREGILLSDAFEQAIMAYLKSKKFAEA